MRRFDELKAGDVVYDCDFDSHAGSPLPANVDLAKSLVKRGIAVPHRDGMVIVWAHECWGRTDDGAVAIYPTRGADDSMVAETPIEAIKECEAWKREEGTAYIRDADALRDIWKELVRLGPIVDMPADIHGDTHVKADGGGASGGGYCTDAVAAPSARGRSKAQSELNKCMLVLRECLIVFEALFYQTGLEATTKKRMTELVQDIGNILGEVPHE